MSAPPGICSSLHLKHSTKFHPLLLQQVLVTQFLLTAEEEAQVSSENEQLEDSVILNHPGSCLQAGVMSWAWKKKLLCGDVTAVSILCQVLSPRGHGW
ncbi:uncharacterized protein LOC135280657 isoform X4 [Passer domesticus]|uniref:uncharacterized protein LOC135280657 isoform X4 n=1 Tax=Passer domesticus TaxID=48849 RepID=UPI0030FF001A